MWGLVTAALFALIAAMSAWADTPAPDAIPFDPRVTRGALSNGMRYFLRENRKPESRLELRLIIHAGSILETDDQQGLAHYVEHMAFNGTRHFEKQELVDYLESLGVAFGPDLNAYTAFDETVYKLQVPTADMAVVRKALLILRDWLDGVTFDPEEIAGERGVVIEEWRGRRGAQQRIMDRHFPVVFKDSLYASRLPIGDIEVLESFQDERLTAYYRDWYRPDLAEIVAVGDTDMKALEAMLWEIFASAASPDTPRARPVSPVPDHEELLVSVVADEEATASTFALYIKREPEPATRLDHYRRMLVQQLSTRMLNQRLDELRRAADPPFLGAYVFTGRLVYSKEMFGIAGHARNNGIARGLETALVEAERVRRHGFTEGELSRAKRDHMRSMERAVKERDKTESRRHADLLVRSIVEGFVVPGVEQELEYYLQWLDGIGLEEVNAELARLMTPGNRVLLVSGPDQEGVSLPSEDALREITTGIASVTLDPYEDDVAEGPLVQDLAPPGSVVATSRVEELDITWYTLSNGIRLGWKATDFKADEVLFSAFSPGGTSLVADEAYIPASSAGGLLRACGLGAFSRIQLEKKLAGIVVNVSPYIEGVQEGLTGACSPDDLAYLFQLVHLWFTAPRKDPDAFQSFTERTRSSLEHRLSDPLAVYADAIRETMTRGHPRRKPWTPETVDAMDLDVSARVFSERFADADDFTFLIVGSVDGEQLADLATQYLANLPVKKGAETWKDLDIDPPPGPVARTVRKGKDPKGRAAVIYHDAMEWTFRERYALRSVAAALNIRLREKLREELAGTYSAGVNPAFEHYPEPRYTVAVTFGCDPGQIDALLAELEGEIDRLRTEPVDEEILTKVKESQIRRREVALKTNSFWLTIMKFYDWHGEDPLQVLAFDAMVESLDAAMMQDAARRYFGTPNRAEFRLIPAVDAQPEQETPEEGEGSP